MKQIILLISFSLIGVACLAAELADIFSDNMVLQQGKPISIWGTGDPGEKITVEFGSQKKETIVDSQGKWQLQLDFLKANSIPHSLVITGKNQLEIKNILVGEVWLCSGQSNMVWTLKMIETPTAEISTLNNPLIRVNSTDRNKWELCTPDKAMDFSGVAFYFGTYLQEKLRVPIGLIVRARGGSPIEPWMPKDVLAANPTTKRYLEKAETPEVHQVIADYDIAVREYLKKYKEWENATPEERKSIATPIPPKQPDLFLEWFGFPQAGNLFNLDIKPVIPYTIRGFIWYQGESNALNKSAAIRHRELLPLLIQSWRKEWQDANLSFYIVQLPNWPQGVFWPYLRESQYESTKAPHTGMIVTIDVGSEELHPKNKKEVGSRLALLAQSDTYGRKIVHSGPIYKSMKVQGNKAILQFTNSGSGLMIKDGILKGFVVAGQDKQFVPGEAVIQETQVIVQSPRVTRPVAVRYGWSPDPVCTLYNKNGLPTIPFRTDSWND